MKAAAECENCALLQRQLEEVRAECAATAEQLNALRLFLARPEGDGEVRYYPTPPSVGEPPLRYVMADAANDTLKKGLLPFQKLARQLASWASSRRKKP